MILTKQQRNKAYRVAYERIAVDSGECICWALEDYDYETLRHFSCYIKMLESVFPEMWLFRPKYYHGYWFRRDSEGQNERLTCLAFCIEMTNQ